MLRPLTVRRAADALLSVVLAPPCGVCGLVMDSPTGGAVCEGCWASIRFFTPPLCDRCGNPVSPVAAAPEAFCPRCAAQPSAIDRSGALGPYEGVLRALVHALKYGGRRSVAPRLSSLVRRRCAALLAAADAVVPVPLHWRRQWARGFNQADAISLGLGAPRWRLLRRTRGTRPQADLDAAERRRNVLGAFALRRGPYADCVARRLSGACVVLVDDVSTTGATLEACAAVLRDAGAAEVRAVTVARTLLGAVPERQREEPAALRV
jgi:ComF family protein